MRIRLSRRAKEHLEDIRAYTIEEFGVRQADLYRGALGQAFVTLRLFPKIGMMSEDLPSNVRAYRVREHWICYRIADDTIEIGAIIRELGQIQFD